jgi:hypothetical protein
MTASLSYWAACLLVGSALPALALASSGPAAPQVAVPPHSHESALQRYRPLSAAELADWRSANRRVQQASRGHAHAPEAAEAAASAPPSAAHKH